MNDNTINPVAEEDYKIILSFVKDFFKTRKLILVLVALFLIIGLINVLITPKIYKSEVTFITQSSGDSKGGSGLGGIAKLLGGSGGANSNSSTSDIPTYLYPTIMESLPFQRELYKTPIKLKGIDSLMTFGDYALEIEKPSIKTSIAKYTIGLPKLIFGSKKASQAPVKSIDSLEFENYNERRIINSLQKKIALVTSDEDGTLEISASMPNEPIASAQLARNAKKILQAEIIRYRVGQAQEKFDFIEKQYELRKAEFEKAQARLANYNDSNLFNTTQSSLIRKRKLEGDSNLLFAIFSDLEQQRLSQSIKIQEDTPTFTTINPAIVPLKPETSNGFKTLIIFGIAGFFLSALIYIFKVTIRYVSTLWEEV